MTRQELQRAGVINAQIERLDLFARILMRAEYVRVWQTPTSTGSAETCDLEVTTPLLRSSLMEAVSFVRESLARDLADLGVSDSHVTSVPA